MLTLFILTSLLSPPTFATVGPALVDHAHEHDSDDDAHGSESAQPPSKDTNTPEPDATSASDETETWNVLSSYGPTHSVAMELEEGTFMSVSAHADTIVFDLLGDIWSIPITGGDATRLTSDSAWDSEPRLSPDGATIAFVSDRSGNENIWTMNADGSDPRQYTHEEEARVTDPVWDPAGDWMIVRRRTVDTRSIGVTELWQVHADGGTGFALTSLDSDPHAGEATVSADGRYIYYSTRNGRFSYDENPVGGLWRIARLDRKTGKTRTIVTGAGSAVRPELSPNGKLLAFVSRDRDKTLLEIMNLETGHRRVLADWLDHDHMEGFALHGVYPDMEWLPDGDLILWAEGQIWRVGLDGVRERIPFKATGEWEFHDVQRTQVTPPEQVTSRVLRWPTTSASGRVAFSAMGRVWIRETDGQTAPIGSDNAYSPAWSPDGKTLAYTTWEDCPSTSLQPTPIETPAPDCGGALKLQRKRRVETLPIRGELVNPAWDETGERLVVLRGRNGSPEPGPADWWEIVLLEKTRRGSWTAAVVGDVGGSGFRAPQLTLHDDRVWWSEHRSTAPRTAGETVLRSMNFDGLDVRTHLVFPGAQEVSISPDFRKVAYKQEHGAHVAALPAQWWGREVSLGALPTRTVSATVGDWLSWGPEADTLNWIEGSTYHSLKIGDLAEPDEDTNAVSPAETPLNATLPRHRPNGVIALTGVTALTMGPEGVIENATIVIEQDTIVSITPGGTPPEGATVYELSGKTVMPGLIDVHAHGHYAHGDVLPQQDWRYLTALDFGVTTIHDPSANTDNVFTMAEMVEAGLMRGPRVFSTGFVLYGALSMDGAKTPDRDAAFGHVRRLQAVGARSVKVYQQSRRDQRQWYVDACNTLEVLCVAEGGGDLWMNLGMLADGFQAIEHALPIAPAYADVQQWMAASHTDTSRGTAYTPTLLVAYGGLSGENYFYQHHSPLDDQRLLRHHPRRALDRKAWRWKQMVHDSDWNHQQTARDAAQMASNDTLVTLGAHGQLQGLGVHWELWALAGPGAMSPMDALRAATLSGAEYLGLEDTLGTIEPGKLADLVVLNKDPRDDIHHSTDISFTIKNGEVFE